MLYDATAEHGACGIGFVADRTGRASRGVLDLVLAGLRGVAHRGATAADGATGDGAGVLLPIPDSLRPEPGCGLAMVFLREPGAEDAIEAACAAEGLRIVSWRDVPVDRSVLGADAARSAPRIRQGVVGPTPFTPEPPWAKLRRRHDRRRGLRLRRG